jgi:hypothetical protein
LFAVPAEVDAEAAPSPVARQQQQETMPRLTLRKVGEK